MKIRIKKACIVFLLISAFSFFIGNCVFAEAEAFDEYPRPRILQDGELKIGFIHDKPEYESCARVVQQARIETAHRGWELIDLVYENEQDLRDNILNLINQDVDAIVMFSLPSMEAKQDLVDMARGKGIGVYNVDNQMIPGIICNSTMPNGVAAMEMMYRIGEDHLWNDNIAIITKTPIQVHVERTDVMKALIGVYPSMSALAEADMSSAQVDELQAANDYTKAWMTKYGDELTGIITSTDYFGVPVAEAVQQAGDINGDKVWVAGIDGGAQAWSYIRDNTPLKYSYAQPFELYVHNVFEIINSMQVLGANPGDDGSMILAPGETIYARGEVVTRENCPAVGESIHAAFEFYGLDPDDDGAWFNWQDAGGPYQVTP